ncbi:MAG TPA: FHA domain-containing protein, partial [Bacillota bacterium]|nr:FHA domain-containing protein [Bacillota bacterium]
VSKQHAVLNFSGESWYIEDLGSTNGSGIKRITDNKRFRLEQGKPYRLSAGDLIYIANIQILVK